MKNQASIVKDLHEKNKFLLKSGYVDSTTEKGNTIILVDGMDQLAMVHNDKRAPKLTEQQTDVHGLPLKKTNAPKFVFLNDKAGKREEVVEEIPEDEFSDLYKAMDVPDLSGQEIIYIKRCEQMGFWRKKFTQEELSSK